MDEKKFNPTKLHKLNNPDRLLDIPPDYIWNKLNIAKPEILVEIGAGTGFFCTSFVNYTNNGKIFACDISDIMIQWMNNNLCPKYPNIVPLKMEETTVPLEDDIANVVYMINLHHELEDSYKILEESFRILKNNGTIFIVDWKKEKTSEGPPMQLRYKSEQVKSQLINAGFEKVNVFNEMHKHFLVVGKKI